MQKTLKPNEDEIKQLLDSTCEPFDDIPYDNFEKFTFINKEDLIDSVEKYIWQPNMNCQTVLGKDNIPIYGLVGYKRNEYDPSFFLMYYSKNTYSNYTKKWSNCLELYSIVIPETLRQQGIAKNILIQLEKLSLHKNIKEVHIKAVTSPVMLSMIKNMGYFPNGNIMNYCKCL